MLRILIILFYPLFLGIWRRAFGCDCWNIPVLKNRAVLHIIGFLVAFGACYGLGYHWIQCLLLGGVLQGLYWARAHGEFFDFGHSNPPNVKRYEQMWWWKYVRKIIPQDRWYQWDCDFICMVVRYTLPAILCSLCLLKAPMCFMGVVLACVYAFMWLMHDWWGLKKPTEYAEFVAGFTTGVFIAC